MSFLSDAGRGLIRWTPKILEVSADDIARFGPQAAQVRALLNFIPTMSDDAVEISSAARNASRGAADRVAWDAADNASRNASRGASSLSARNAAEDAARYGAFYGANRESAKVAADRAAKGEVVSDLITPEAYRTLTNPAATARALDRLAGRAPESFVPIARGLGERGLVSAPADIVIARRIAGLPPQQQTLIMGLVDSGLTLEEAIAAARALS